MSPQYKCNDCGFVWTDIEAKDVKTKKFIRCLRCESRNIAFPKTLKISTKLIIWLIASLITGMIGTGVGIWIHSKYNWGDPESLGLIGFLIGFFVPTIVILIIEGEDGFFWGLCD
jgi:DNA-directed RNA polymerase subunit RPC12/RpoP